MIELIDVRKTYDKKTKHAVEALKGISTVFPDTGMVFIVGRSGGGKSTLLNILGGLDTYDDGDFLINGVSTKGFTAENWNSYRNHYVGFVFQDHRLITEYTVGENVSLALALQNEKEDKEKVAEALKTVGLEGFGNRRILKLSGGQRQRVAIARALVKDYQMILADEPTGNLDANSALEIFGLLKEISKTKLVVVVTHDVNAANHFADVAIAINNGKLTESAIKDGFVVRTKRPQCDTANQSVEQLIANAFRTGGTAEDTYANGLQESAGAPDAAKAELAAADAQNGQIASVRPQNITFKKTRLSSRATWMIIGKSLKKRAVRISISVFLCLIAFIMLVSVFKVGTWTPYKAHEKLLNHDGYSMVEVYEKQYDEITGRYKYRSEIRAEEINELEGKFRAAPFYKVYDSSISRIADLGNDLTMRERFYYNDNIVGVCAIDEEGLKRMGFSLLAGSFPQPSWSATDVVISKYIYEIFALCGYYDGVHRTSVSGYGDLLGKKLERYTIRGIIETNIDEKTFASVKEYALNPEIKKEPGKILTSVCQNQFQYNYGEACHTVLFKNARPEYETQNVKYLVHINDKSETKTFAKYIIDSGIYRFSGFYSKEMVAIRDNFKDKTFCAVVAVIGLFFATIGVLVLLNLLASIFRETKDEIGILRCVGASNKDVLSIYLYQAALIGAAIFLPAVLLFAFVFAPWLPYVLWTVHYFPIRVFPLSILDVLFLFGSLALVLTVACIPLFLLTRKSPAEILVE